MSDEDKLAWLTDKSTRELRNIGRCALDRDKAKWMKGNAFLLMGQFAEFEDNRVHIEKEEALARSVSKKVTLENFLVHHEEKHTESSRITKKILSQIWVQTEVSPEERLRVGVSNSRCGKCWLGFRQSRGPTQSTTSR